jgi:hypothetical protein
MTEISLQTIKQVCVSVAGQRNDALVTADMIGSEFMHYNWNHSHQTYSTGLRRASESCSLHTRHHMSYVSGVRVIRSLGLCVCFVDCCLSFCPFSFDHCVVCSSLIYGFWLPLWYLQTLLRSNVYAPMLPSGFEVPSKMAILAAYETHMTSMRVANLHEQIALSYYSLQ